MFPLHAAIRRLTFAPATAEYFVAVNGLAAPPQTSRLPDGNPGDTPLVERAIWSRGGASIVAFYIIDGGGHVVSQPVYRWPQFLGRTTKQFCAPTLTWDVFAHSKPNKTVGIARSRVSEVRESAQH
jgi:polyhydroxybutyrate depolymerase